MNVYEDMQQILKDRGRCTTTMTKHNGSTCLVGASRLATGTDYDFMFRNEFRFYEDTPQTDKLAKIIKEQFPDSPFLNLYDIEKSHVICYTFNDGHSDEDVMLILEKAAADE